MPGNVVDRSGNISSILSDIEQRLRALERREQPTGSYDAGVDVYPDGETIRGLWARTVNRMGIEQYTDHHQADAMPAGFAWAEGSGFGGEPDVQWARRGSFMRWELTAAPHFLFDSIGTYDNRRFYARLRVGSASEIGVRLDDGGTANYAEIVLDPNQAGAYVIDFRHKKAEAAETDSPGPTVVATQYTVVQIAFEDNTVYGRLMAEDGDAVTMEAWTSGTVSWTPARVGFVSRGSAGAAPVASDWFYNTFE